MWFRLSLPVIPVLIVTFILWFILGGIYLSLVPENYSGEDNMGINLAVLGLCLFLVDRLAYIFLNSHSWLIIMKTWMWGMVFMIAGFVIWIKAFGQTNALVFVIHWLATLGVIAVLTWFALEHVEPTPTSPPAEGEANETETGGD